MIQLGTSPPTQDYEVDLDPGLPSDEFTFRVTYLDDEGLAPEFVVGADGTDYPMKLEGKVRSCGRRSLLHHGEGAHMGPPREPVRGIGRRTYYDD